MVFNWLFGEKKKQEPASPELASLIARAEEATDGRQPDKGEPLCRELLRASPDNADAWNMLGVNLIRRDPAAPPLRAEAVLAWMRALALRPGDSRAADHLRVEIQYPEEIVPELIRQLGSPAPAGDDAYAVLAQVGEKARPALERTVASGGPIGERAKGLLAALA